MDECGIDEEAPGVNEPSVVGELLEHEIICSFGVRGVILGGGYLMIPANSFALLRSLSVMVGIFMCCLEASERDGGFSLIGVCKQELG